MRPLATTESPLLGTFRSIRSICYAIVGHLIGDVLTCRVSSSRRNNPWKKSIYSIRMKWVPARVPSFLIGADSESAARIECDRNNGPVEKKGVCSKSRKSCSRSLWTAFVNKRVEAVGLFGMGPKTGLQISTPVSLFPFLDRGNYSWGSKNGVLVTS